MSEAFIDPMMIISPPLFGQHVKDTLCFTIPLNQDPASLFGVE